MTTAAPCSAPVTTVTAIDFAPACTTTANTDNTTGIAQQHRYIQDVVYAFDRGPTSFCSPRDSSGKPTKADFGARTMLLGCLYSLQSAPSTILYSPDNMIVNVVLTLSQYHVTVSLSRSSPSCLGRTRRRSGFVQV